MVKFRELTAEKIAARGRGDVRADQMAAHRKLDQRCHDICTARLRKRGALMASQDKLAQLSCLVAFRVCELARS
jgi:hypothetical protein